MAGPSDRRENILTAALRQVEKRGWRQLSLRDVAAAAEVPLIEVLEAFPTKPVLLAGLIRRIDHEVVSMPPPDPEESARDRLFDVLMRRFDCLAPHKQAVAAILRDLPSDPVTLLRVLPRFALSMAWMLEAAGLSSRGLRGAMRAEGLAAIYLNAVRAWLEDDSPDMAHTMAAVDLGLRRAESIVDALRHIGISPPSRRQGNVADTGNELE